MSADSGRSVVQYNVMEERVARSTNEKIPRWTLDWSLDIFRILEMDLAIGNKIVLRKGKVRGIITFNFLT